MAHTIVIFGASGDLTRRKLIPALYRLHRQQRLPADTRIVGVSRTAFSHDAWREQLSESTTEFTGDDYDVAAFGEFVQKVLVKVIPKARDGLGAWGRMSQARMEQTNSKSLARHDDPSDLCKEHSIFPTNNNSSVGISLGKNLANWSSLPD